MRCTAATSTRGRGFGPSTLNLQSRVTAGRPAAPSAPRIARGFRRGGGASAGARLRRRATLPPRAAAAGGSRAAAASSWPPPAWGSLEPEVEEPPPAGSPAPTGGPEPAPGELAAGLRPAPRPRLRWPGRWSRAFFAARRADRRRDAFGEASRGGTLGQAHVDVGRPGGAFVEQHALEREPLRVRPFGVAEVHEQPVAHRHRQAVRARSRRSTPAPRAPSGPRRARRARRARRLRGRSGPAAAASGR